MSLHKQSRHDHIDIRVTRNEKKLIQSAMQNGEMSEVARALLMMYVGDTQLQEQVRVYRELQT